MADPPTPASPAVPAKIFRAFDLAPPLKVPQDWINRPPPRRVGGVRCIAPQPQTPLGADEVHGTRGRSFGRDPSENLGPA
jgi:hypothetical protein